MSEFRRKLAWILLLRVTTLTMVLGFASILSLPPEPQRYRLLIFLGASYAFSAASYVLIRLVQRDRLLFYLQFFFDLIFVHLLVSYSGGRDSVFVWLYLLLIAYSSILLQRKGGLLAAGLSVLSFIAIVNTGFYQLTPGEAYRVAVTLLGFLVVAYLGIYLAERIKQFSTDLEVSASSLANLRALHEHVITSIRSGLLTTDLNGTITIANRAACQITGYFQNELQGATVALVLGEAGLQKILQADFTRTRNAVRLETWARSRRGRHRFLGSGTSPLLDQDGRRLGFVVAFQDLTEVKRLEQEVATKKKMAAVGMMAAGIAHEIRNPLGSMSGSIQLLRQKLTLPDDQARLMEIVLRESDRLNKIIEDFLSYARPRPVEFAPVDVAHLIGEMIELLQNSPEKLPSHQIEFSERNPLFCLGSADQLRQVFWNLAANALRAMPQGGTLEIRVGRNARYVRVRMRDSGCGMSAEEIERIHQPFATGFPKGIGLGMAIVYQIVQNHNGKLRIRSQKGAGTAVTVSLPLAAVGQASSLSVL